jgi:peroxiredoxin
VALFGLLTLLVCGFFGLIFFQAQTAKPRAAGDLFERLSIERPEKIIRAPDFSLEDLSGRRLTLKELKGQVVFLNFWATWCVPCRQEMPFMEALHREFKDRGLEVVAVNFREDGKTAQKFFTELGLTFRGLLDPDGGVSNEYGAWSLPLTYLIDRKGEFVGKTIGDRRWYSEDARAFFRELLEEKE